MKPQVIELQVENKNMDEMNKMITKTNHYQELIKTMEKEKGMKQILVRDKTKTKREYKNYIISEVHMEQSKLKDRSKELERLKTEITKMKVNIKCCIF